MAKDRVQHTPGPWELGPSFEDEPGEVDVMVRPVRENGVIALAIARPEHRTEAEAEANARLIAAAPELLAKLETCAHELVEATAFAVRTVPNGQHNAGRWNTAVAEARDAIHKAVSR